MPTNNCAHPQKRLPMPLAVVGIGVCVLLCKNKVKATLTWGFLSNQSNVKLLGKFKQF
jgi:hypothetical protein